MCLQTALVVFLFCFFVFAGLVVDLHERENRAVICSDDDDMCAGQLIVTTCWSTLALTTRDPAWCWQLLEVRTGVMLCSAGNVGCYSS